MAVHIQKCLLNVIKCQKSYSHLQLVNAYGFKLAYRGLSGQPDDQAVTAKTVESSQRKNLGGSEDNPVVITSAAKKTIVGCNCSSDDPTLRWFYLEEGSVQSCYCGYFFKLNRVDESQLTGSPNVMDVDEDQEDLRRERDGLPFL